MSMSAEQLAQFNALLNVPLGQIEDLPDFATFPVGIYHLKGKSGKLDPEGGMLGLTLELVEAKELGEGVDPASVPEAGTLTGVRYYGGFGIAKWKQAWGLACASANCASVTEFVDQFGNLEFIVTLGVRTDKDDKTKKYQEVTMATLI